MRNNRTTRALHTALLLTLGGVFADVFGQTFTWNPVTTGLPPSIQVFEGTASGPIRAFYARIDYADTSLIARALTSPDTDGKSPLSSIAAAAGAYVAVNGGYFNTASNPAVSYSLIVTDGNLIARQISNVTRTSGFYTVVRPALGVSGRSFETAWIYHFGNTLGDMHRFAGPLQNTTTLPAAAPLVADGSPWVSIREAIGGGPNLVSNGQVNVTYEEEVFFESGVEASVGQPRTAIGHTAGNALILFVADGRQTFSAGMTLGELAQTMIGLGCVEAINLDGGGSSTMVAAGAVLNSPSDGAERHIPSAFGVVPAPAVPVFEKTYDTDDVGYQEYGSGWITTANPGSFGLGSRLNPVGTGEDRAVFRPALPVAGVYDVYGWWVSASNRAPNTPFIIFHNGSIDTVRLDQRVNGSSWQKIGTFPFAGTSADSIVISDNATGGPTTYVAVDGLRIVRMGTPTHTGGTSAPVPRDLSLDEPYPNPCNPSTTISFALPREATVSIRVWNILGQVVETLTDGQFRSGVYRVVWNAAHAATGSYMVRMTVTGSDGTSWVLTRKLLLVR